MHHVLQIGEIVLKIFRHCHPPARKSAASDLPALARTCRTFNGPALDILWEELPDSSPLAKCVPGAFHHSETNNTHSFTRPLAQGEWEVLRSYARRVRSILDYNRGLDWESVEAFLTTTLTEPLLPNLRHFHAPQITQNTFMRMLAAPIPFQSLISLDVSVLGENNLDILAQFIDLFSSVSPDIRILSVHTSQYGVRSTLRPGTRFCIPFSRYICRWENLQIVDCGDIPLEADAVAHLSRRPALTSLSCAPSSPFPDSITPICFSNLPALRLKSQSLATVSLFLSRMRLPTAAALSAFIEDRFSKQDLHSFLASVQTCIHGNAVQELRLKEGKKYDYRDTSVLDFEDIRPCMAFGNLRRIDINVSWFVELTDGDLLQLASAWPRLEELLINERSGWTASGITPIGVVRLLQTSPLLCNLALTIDTRDVTDFNESAVSPGLTLPPTFTLNVLDSFIYEDDVPAVATLLACIARASDLSLRAFHMDAFPRHCARWHNAFQRVKAALGQECSPFVENDNHRHRLYRFNQH